MAPIWLDVLDETVRVCAAHGRADLVRRLRQKRAQLLDPTLRVLVIGEPKQGKSQLINALINAPVCPVGDGLTTAIPTVVRHAEPPEAALVQAPPGETAEPADPVRATSRTPVPVADLPARISASVPPRPGAGPVHAEVGVPRGLLASGLVLVDTPGVDGDDPTQAADTVASPARADVVVLVSDASRELSTAEVNLLLRVMRDHPHIIVALTKIDLSPHWRQLAERSREHLASAGVPAPVIPVSSVLRLQAAQSNDKAINAESGFPDLIARLMRYLGAKSDVLAPTTVGLLAAAVVEQLAGPLRAGLTAQAASEPLARLYEAQRALDELRRASTRWQNRLSDDITDLLSDVEYDLRDRTRRIIREVDEAFDSADPLRTWESFQTWLTGALTEAAEANFAWLVQRCDWIAGRIADHFVQYGADILPEWKAELPEVLGDGVTPIGQPNVERFTVTEKFFTGLRGSYGGVLMVGLVTTLAGEYLINPYSVGAGVLFAAKAIRDESKAVRKRRQAAVKAAAQRHVDDFFLRLTKECRDTIRWVHRLLRDHYTALTEQLQDGIVQSLRSAKQAADADAAARDRRHRDIQQQMKRLAVLYERAQGLTGTPTSSTVAGLEPGV